MEELGFRSFRSSPVQLVVSAIVVLSSHFGLSLVPRFLFPFLSIPAMLPVSGVVMVAAIAVGRCWKRIIGVQASASAVVVFNVVFIWGVYYFLIRPDASLIVTIIFHIGYALLMVGLYSIISCDPGFVLSECSFIGDDRIAYSRDDVVTGSLFTRVRWCSSCKANVRGFDHHCPAFGNCIGQKNHRLFLILLIGFILSEASYVACSSKSQTQVLLHMLHMALPVSFASYDITKILNTNNVLLQSTISGNLVLSTMLFSLLQMFWQIPFLIWHLYCICFNIKTDEWVHWKKYPEFHLIVERQHSDEPPQVKFRNPYDRGIYNNVKEFLCSG